MEKTLTIDGKQIRFKSSGGVMMRYRNQFNADFLAEVRALSEEQFSFAAVERIVWVLAKTADSFIPDPQTWLDGFDSIDLLSVWRELSPLITASLNTKVKNAETAAATANQ